MELEIYLTRPSMSLIRIHIVSKDRIQFCNIEMPVGWLMVINSSRVQERNRAREHWQQERGERGLCA